MTSILIEEHDNVFKILQEKNGNVAFVPTEKQHNVFKELYKKSMQQNNDFYDSWKMI